MTKPHLFRTTALAAASICCAVLAGSCGGKKPAPEPAEQRVLVIDGITVTFADLEPYTEFLGGYLPESGTKTRNMQALMSHVLPLEASRRAFADERKVQYERAKALCDVATNVLELEQQTELMVHRKRSNLVRAKAPMPVGIFLFDPLNTNAVSPPIEVPSGWFVVGSFDYFESPLVISDYVDALQVGFITHTSREWFAWWEEAKVGLGQKVTFVHPDYRDEMPEWVQLPKDS
ncbi:MAG: hypothetical protein AB8H80_06725 [Planctomycetota bacterium]